jgi:hypothetical protein
VLIFALVFLAAIALISMTLMQTTTMELRMAGNEQERVETLQKVQAVIDQIIDDEDYFPVLQTGTLICQLGDTDTDCDSSTTQPAKYSVAMSAPASGHSAAPKARATAT